VQSTVDASQRQRPSPNGSIQATKLLTAVS